MDVYAKEKIMNKRNRQQSKKTGFIFQVPVNLGIILALLDILIIFINWPAGLVLAAFVIFYYVIIVYFYFHNRQIITNEMIRFATEYGQIQNLLMRELVIPYALLDETGRILWTNEAFEQTVHKDPGYRKSITTIFSMIHRDVLPKDEREVRMPVDFDDKNYMVEMRRIPVDDMLGDRSILTEPMKGTALIAFYMIDDTAARLALQEVDDQSLVIGFVYIDNYDEAINPLDNLKKSMLVALIERQVTKYFLSVDGICSKIDNDKYIVVLRKKSLQQLQDTRFKILSDIKGLNIGNPIPITLSIGIGLDGLTYAQNLEFARNAVDAALGRGGDQAVVKMSDKVTYYGGKTQQVEKNTRVRARVKAQALKEIIFARDIVFIMGHKMGDPDSFGAALGIYRICKTLERKAYIVLNEKTTSILQAMSLFENNPEYDMSVIIDSQRAIDMVTDNAALVVVDVNQPSRTECPELLKLCKSIVVLDHHRVGKDVIENATLSYVETYASSACEMVSEILQYIGENVKIRPEEADAIYGGMVVDTNNFVSKAGVRTFEAAAFLRRCGADVTRVRKLFREDVTEFKAKANVVSSAEIYRDSYAISTCPSEGLRSPTIVGAQAANELLDIEGVKASFVLTLYQGKIYVSARSIDDVNVQVIMEKLGGGGHMNMAGCQIKEISMEEAINVIKKTIDETIKEDEAGE